MCRGEFSFNVGVDEERKRKYIPGWRFLSPSAVAHLQEQISKRGFDVSCSALDPVIIGYFVFKDHIYLNHMKLVVTIPEDPKNEGGYVSDGWDYDFKASMTRDVEEFRKCISSDVKNPLHESKSSKK